MYQINPELMEKYLRKKTLAQLTEDIGRSYQTVLQLKRGAYPTEPSATTKAALAYFMDSTPDKVIVKATQVEHRPN